MTLVPQARQARPSGEILNYLLSRLSDILSMIIGQTEDDILTNRDKLDSGDISEPGSVCSDVTFQT